MFHNHRRTLGVLIATIAAAGAASFFTSTGLAGAGDLFASDPTANTIRVFALDGSTRIFAKGLNLPQGLVFDDAGNLFVADKGSGNIYKFTADGTRSTFATGLDQPIGISFDGTQLAVAENGAGTVTRLDQDGNKTVFMNFATPLGLTFETPNLYLADSTSLIEIGPTNQLTTTPVAGSRDVAVDGTDNAYVSSTDGSITMVTPNGVASTFVSGLTTPNGLAFRPKRYSSDEEGVGDLFVAETQAGQVSEFASDGVKKVFATGGNPKYLTFELILPGKLLNISTRLRAGTGDNVLIGGFILQGTGSKTVVLRAIGPSLANSTNPVANTLADTVLELHKPDGTVVTNDNWTTNGPAHQTIITDTGLDMYNGQPISNKESIIVATLDPGPYTAIVRGKNGGTGVAMVEAYDINGTDPGELANISTRGLVGTGDDCIIGGFIIGATDPGRVLIRAIGPSLAHAAVPVPNPLMDPFLELHDAQGNVTKTNNDWADTAEGEISATGIPPTDPRESAILDNLLPGEYTAVVKGNDGGTGVALVEIYHLP